MRVVVLGGLFHGTLRRLGLTGRFADAGLSAVLGMRSAPGVTFDPEPFLKELEERGITTQVAVTRGL